MSDGLPIKVVLLGETAVGKSCLIARFISDTFITNHITTMAGSFSSKNVFYDKANKKIQYEIWDTAGQEKYRAVNKMFYQDASVIILVLDITRRDTFEAIKNYWYPELRDNAPKDVIYAIAANKCDLYEYEEIKDEELKEYALSINAIYKHTSALQNSGINDLFDYIGYKILAPDNYEEFIKKTNSKKPIKLEKDPIDEKSSKESKSNRSVNKKKGCC